MNDEVEALILCSKIFGSKDIFIQWLYFPHEAFGGQPPLNLLRTGKADIILSELRRIERGVSS